MGAHEANLSFFSRGQSGGGDVAGQTNFAGQKNCAGEGVARDPGHGFGTRETTHRPGGSGFRSFDQFSRNFKQFSRNFKQFSINFLRTKVFFLF